MERAEGTNLPGTVESGEILKSPRSRRLTTGRPEAVETVETGKGMAATPPAGGPGTYTGAAAAAAAELVLWVYEGQTTKVPVFFEAFAPFQEALGAALEEKICDGSFGAGSVVGLDEAVYHKKLRAFKLTCINKGSVQPIKGLVLDLVVGKKTYRAWGAGEEPGSFNIVAFLSLWQRTPLERVLMVLSHHNPGIPLGGTEALAIWEQERSRKVDLKTDQAFYDFARNSNWRLKYTMGYGECFVGVHSEVAARQENQVTVWL